jgi:sugar phosphate isomerase/epimerase
MTKTDEPTWTLSGFGDEIDPDPVLQLAVLQALGASHLELRSAWGVNVVDFDDDHLRRIKAMLAEREMAVSAIASPLGKVDVHTPVQQELTRLRAAIRAAHAVHCRYIRIFSFYRSDSETPEDIRDEVLAHLTAQAELARSEGVVLLHENEKEIYGDVPERVLDLVTAVDSPALRLAWDNANFVQVGIRPFTDGWAELAPYVEYLQVKDARMSDGAVTPAGEGDGELVQTLTALRDAGFDGFASLEPHLAVAGRMGGFSGPGAFGRAARALRRITDALGIELI